MLEDKHQVNPRLSQEVYEILVLDSENNNISKNEMASLRLEQLYTKLQAKRDRGDIIMLRSNLERILDDSKSIEENAKQAALDVTTEMKMQVDELILEEFEKRTIEWHILNKFKINSFDNNERRKYVVGHTLDPRWSEFQCIMYSEMFKIIGETVISSEFNDVSFTIEITKPKN